MGLFVTKSDATEEIDGIILHTLTKTKNTDEHRTNAIKTNLPNARTKRGSEYYADWASILVDI